jgi:site-specific recombinase XerD
MTEEQQKAVNDYLIDLKLHNKYIKNAKYNLNVYFRYINEYDLNWLRMKIGNAQEFQMYLITKTKDDGEIYYRKRSVLVIIGSVRVFYDYLKRKGAIFTNPFKELRRVKRGEHLPKNILNEDDMNKFLKHLKEFRKGERMPERKSLYRTHVIAELMYSSGMRIEEVIKLVPSDIDFYRGSIRITDSKTGKMREGILNSFAEKVLRIYVDEMREHILSTWTNADDRLLFGAGGHLKISLNEALTRESEKLKLGRFTSHNFRHALGYHLLRGGCDIRFIQDILGHKVLASTQVYTKVDKEDLKNVLDEYHPRVLHREHHPLPDPEGEDRVKLQDGNEAL